MQIIIRMRSETICKFLLESDLPSDYIIGFGCYNDDAKLELLKMGEELKSIAYNTMHFLNGFYSDFALELLSSVDYIASIHKSYDKELISSELEKWSNRKRSMFSNPKYLDISIKHLKSAQLGQF